MGAAAFHQLTDLQGKAPPILQLQQGEKKTYFKCIVLSEECTFIATLPLRLIRTDSKIASAFNQVLLQPSVWDVVT